MQDADVKSPGELLLLLRGDRSGADAGDEKRTRMSWTDLVGAAGVALVGSFLPWAAASGGDTLGGFSWGPGKVTAVVAILLGLYGAQGLRKDDPNVRHHGWAIAALVIGILTAVFSQTILDNIDSLTLGVGDIHAGTGLIATVLVLCFAIWPLVVLRKDAKARAGGGASAATSATQRPAKAQRPSRTERQATAQHSAGWYADPMSRFERRYFDGSAWTEHVANGQDQATDPVHQA